MSSIVATELTYQQASSLRKGGHLMIKGHPCKIIEMTTHKSGKHGGAKCKFTAVGTQDTKRREALYGSKEMVECPVFATAARVSAIDTTEPATSKAQLKAEKKAAAAARRAERKQRKAEKSVSLCTAADGMSASLVGGVDATVGVAAVTLDDTSG